MRHADFPRVAFLIAVFLPAFAIAIPSDDRGAAQTTQGRGD